MATQQLPTALNHEPIILKVSKSQPKAHYILFGPNRIRKHIRYKIEHRINDKKIILFKNEYYNLFLDFIIDLNYNLVLGDYHLFLSDDSDYVQGAGRIIINNKGNITKLDNKSGHYKPSLNDCIFMFEYFKLYFTLETEKFFVIDKRPKFVESYKAYISDE
jgi:hypothetical protein